jgi:signal transduction histidine kinase
VTGQAPPDRPGRWGLYWRALVVAVFAVVVSVGVMVKGRDHVEIKDQRDAAQYAGDAVLPVVRALETQLAAAAVPGSGSRRVGIDDPDGPSPAAAALARDTGAPALDDAMGGVVVTPVYDPAGPTTVAERREDLVGFAVTPLDLGPTMETAATGSAWLTVAGPTGTVESVGDRPEHAVGVEIDLDESGAPGWILEAAVPARPMPLQAWLVALTILLGGLTVAWTMIRQSRRNEVRHAEAVGRQRAEATITELASVAQHSLDLAEVLPASFAVLEASLQLEGVTLLNANGRPTFVWREAPSDDEPSHPFDTPVPAGCCLSIPLSRGGRSLGTLRVRPGRDLDDLDLSTLTGAAETLSSAIANAEAYAHQRAMITRMRTLDDLKTVFVATASHELRTPVAAVIGYANMLVDNWDDLDAETGLLYAQRVDTNARRLADLVEHLLDFSRLEQGGSYQGERVQIDLGEEVAELTLGLRDLIQDHDLQLTTEPGQLVSGSKLAVERVLTNLVGNAAKYSPAGSTITIRVEGEADLVKLVVDDEGPGVPEQEREQVFSRFFRGGGEEVVRTRGAGLGLSIVTEFAASMGGVVSTGAAPSGGARFEVTYPRHDPDDPVDVSDPRLARSHVPDQRRSR